MHQTKPWGLFISLPNEKVFLFTFYLQSSHKKSSLGLVIYLFWQTKGKLVSSFLSPHKENRSF
ncbi:MAG: hypothetical protein CK425_01125 [Parachlamydia sp.]|nr:MAG: hypothetical protein CK425_01125 [Parachlamydia sp.]